MARKTTTPVESPRFAVARSPTLGPPIPVRFTDAQAKTIAREAKRIGCSRVDVIRRALDQYFAVPASERDTAIG